MAAQLSDFSRAVEANHVMQDNRGPAAPDPTVSPSAGRFHATYHQTYPSPILRKDQKRQRGYWVQGPKLGNSQRNQSQREERWLWERMQLAIFPTQEVGLPLRDQKCLTHAGSEWGSLQDTWGSWGLQKGWCRRLMPWGKQGLKEEVRRVHVWNWPSLTTDHAGEKEEGELALLASWELYWSSWKAEASNMKSFSGRNLPPIS